jgi:molybdenum cofactor synthesis domain-containing protein
MKVGLIIIGNEILSGRFADANTPFLAQMLLTHGVHVGEVAILPDDIVTVAGKICEYSSRFDLVITTGGIGPTHDDITLDAVSKAVGRPLVEHPDLVAIAQEKIGTLNEATRKLTRVPEGTELLDGGRFVWPPLKVDKIVVLPGVPALIRAQFPALVQLLPDDLYFEAELRCMAREVDLAACAGETDEAFEDVDVGSYPIIGSSTHHVLMRFTGTDAVRIEEAVVFFLERVPADTVVERVDRDDQ